MKNDPRKTGLVAAVVVALASPFVAYNEGVIPYTYADPVWGWKVPTACAGETGPHIKRGQNYTMDECMAMLDRRLTITWGEIEPCIRRPLQPHEAVAVLDLAHNVGAPAVCRSTMVAQINAGAPASQWCAQLSRWTKAGGREWPGLVKRRAKARAICEGRAEL